jgi:hypothetical protein
VRPDGAVRMNVAAQPADLPAIRALGVETRFIC